MTVVIEEVDYSVLLLFKKKERQKERMKSRMCAINSCKLSGLKPD